jgi:phosphatidylserine decarboxylase
VHQRISSWTYPPAGRAKAITLAKGEEMGRFNMGSTVILLFGKDAVEWVENLSPGKQLKMGEIVGETSS